MKLKEHIYVNPLMEERTREKDRKENGQLAGNETEMELENPLEKGMKKKVIIIIMIKITITPSSQVHHVTTTKTNTTSSFQRRCRRGRWR